MDYLTVSLPKSDSAGRIFRVLCQLLEAKRDSQVFENGYSGLACCASYGRVLLRQHDDGPAADVLVRLPGRALEWIRDSTIFSDSEAPCTDARIAGFFLDHAFRATRVDVTIDTSDSEVSPQLVKEHLQKENFTCRARRAGVNDSWQLDRKTGIAAETVYIGGRSSTRFMRIYDKRAETLNSIGKDLGHRTRFELECKSEAGRRVTALISKAGAGCIPSIFKGWIDFKDPGDKNPRVDRRRSAAWWQRIVGDDAPIVIGLTRGVSSPERSVKWVKHQVSKTLYLARQYGAMPEIESAVKGKAFKVKDSDRAKWEHYASTQKKDAKPDGWGSGNAIAE